jgi:hypothetical protein
MRYYRTRYTTKITGSVLHNTRRRPLVRPDQNHRSQRRGRSYVFVGYGINAQWSYRRVRRIMGWSKPCLRPYSLIRTFSTYNHYSRHHSYITLCVLPSTANLCNQRPLNVPDFPFALPNTIKKEMPVLTHFKAEI